MRITLIFCGNLLRLRATGSAAARGERELQEAE